jgi:hypothetical protein
MLIDGFCSLSNNNLHSDNDDGMAAFIRMLEEDIVLVTVNLSDNFFPERIVCKFQNVLWQNHGMLEFNIGGSGQEGTSTQAACIRSTPITHPACLKCSTD